MNILVLDVAAETGGALTILNTFIDKFSENPSNTYYVCVSRAKIKGSENVVVLKFPWVKNSWIHRLWFDYKIAKALVKRYGIDEVLSLQNNLLPVKDIPQDLYLHQPLPFVEKRYSILQDYKIWAYQNLVSVFIYRAVKKARKITVQTHWMKQAVIEKCKVEANKIEVCPPYINMEIVGSYAPSKPVCHFFYPANPLLYKNHLIIFKAVEILVNSGITAFRIKFTLDHQTLPKSCRELYRQYKQYFILTGKIDYEKVLKEYCQSILLFPSYIETFGLPLLEARSSDTPIIASDCKFCHEILDGYKKAHFFPPSEAKILADCMKEFIEAWNIKQS